MPNRLFEINGFEGGMIQDETQSSNRSFDLVSGIDVFSEVGVAKPSVRLDEETITDIGTDEKDWFAYWSTESTADNTEVWAVGAGKLHKKIGGKAGSWRLVHTITSGGGSFVSGVHAIYPFNDEMYYSNSTHLGRAFTNTLNGAITDAATSIVLTSATGLPTSGDIIIDEEIITYTGISTNTLTGCTRGVRSSTAAAHSDGATVAGFNDTYQTFLADDKLFKPMVLFEGSLMVGDGRYIAKLDPDTTWTNNALTLPAEYRVRSLEVIGQYLAIGTYKKAQDGNANIEHEAVVFFWDGTSTSYNFKVDAETNGIKALKAVNQRLYAIAGNELGVFVYNGANFDKIFDLSAYLEYNPNAQQSADVLPGAIAGFNGGILIGINSNSTEKGGVYEFTQNSSGQYSLIRRFVSSNNSPSTDDCYAIHAVTPSDLFISWVDGSGNRIIDKTNSFGYVYGISGTHTPFIRTTHWEIMNDQGFNSFISGIKAFVSKTSGTFYGSITVKYKLDYANSFTTLGTISSTNIDQILYSIYKRGNTIQLQFEFNYTVDSSTNIPKATKFELY